MITYSASDIIQRSRQIADLENSDFINYEEEISLLNEAFVKMYQDMINANASAFVKTIEVKPKDTYIPDLYQIRSINVLSGHIRTPIFQRPLDQSSTTPSYEIRENKIHFNNVGGTVEIQYWPVPQTLSFPFKPYKLDEENKIICSNNDYYVIQNSDGYFLKEFDDPETLIELTGEAGYISDDYVVSYDEDSNSYIFKSLYDLEEYSFNKSTCSILIYNGNAYVVSEGNTYSPIDENFLSPIEEIIPIFGNGISFDNFVNINGDVITTINGQTLTSKFPITSSFQDENNVYIFTNSQYYIIANGDTIQEYYTDYQIISLSRERFITRKLNKYFFKSALADTKLDFPNNVFFVYLAYILALCYCGKQNKDPAYIAPQALAAEKSFYNTVREDAWSVSRITNCY